MLYRIQKKCDTPSLALRIITQHQLISNVNNIGSKLFKFIYLKSME